MRTWVEEGTTERVTRGIEDPLKMSERSVYGLIAPGKSV